MLSFLVTIVQAYYYKQRKAVPKDNNYTGCSTNVYQASVGCSFMAPLIFILHKKHNSKVLYPKKGTLLLNLPPSVCIYSATWVRGIVDWA